METASSQEEGSGLKKPSYPPSKEPSKALRGRPKGEKSSGGPQKQVPVRTLSNEFLARGCKETGARKSLHVWGESKAASSLPSSQSSGGGDLLDRWKSRDLVVGCVFGWVGSKPLVDMHRTREKGRRPLRENHQLGGEQSFNSLDGREWDH